MHHNGSGILLNYIHINVLSIIVGIIYTCILLAGNITIQLSFRFFIKSNAIIMGYVGGVRNVSYHLV